MWPFMPGSFHFTSFSRSTRVVASNKTAFPFSVKHSATLHGHNIWLNHSLADGHRGYVHFGAIMNSAARNTHVQTLVQCVHRHTSSMICTRTGVFILPGCIPEMELLSH